MCVYNTGIAVLVGTGFFCGDSLSFGNICPDSTRKDFSLRCEIESGDGIRIMIRF